MPLASRVHDQLEAFGEKRTQHRRHVTHGGGFGECRGDVEAIGQQRLIADETKSLELKLIRRGDNAA